MLRLFVAVLLLANLGFYAWTQGMLDGVVGAKPQGDREPERLTRQVRPETIRVMPPVASAVAAVAEQPQVCLEAGPYTPAQVSAAESVLQTVLPPGSWANVKTEAPAVWIVYMGKYSNRDAMQKKADELKRLKIAFEEVRNAPELEDGLALGRYDSRASAERALADVTQRGVRTARVATLSPATTTHSLRVDRADAGLQNRLAGLRAEALLGKPFALCAAKP